MRGSVEDQHGPAVGLINPEMLEFLWLAVVNQELLGKPTTIHSLVPTSPAGVSARDPNPHWYKPLGVSPRDPYSWAIIGISSLIGSNLIKPSVTRPSCRAWATG